MTLSRTLAAAAVSALLAGSALAQTATQPPATQPTRPAVTTPATPAAPARPAATAPAAQNQAARVNLNSATAAELDGLPQIGAARAQTIITERGKGRFRDWADFERRMAGTSVNQQALNAIKERVRF
jgi:competence protein ComEA